MTINQVFIVGSGLMRSDTAQVSANSGIDATVGDVNEAFLKKAKSHIAWSVGKFVEKGKVAGTVDQVIGRIASPVKWPAALGTT